MLAAHLTRLSLSVCHLRVLIQIWGRLLLLVLGVELLRGLLLLGLISKNLRIMVLVGGGVLGVIVLLHVTHRWLLNLLLLMNWVPLEI